MSDKFPNRVECIVTCQSKTAVPEVKEVVRDTTDPGVVMTRTFITFPGGTECKRVERLLLADYFESIDLLPWTSPSFRLVFLVKKLDDSTWKFLVVSILREIEKLSPGTTTRIIPCKLSETKEKTA